MPFSNGDIGFVMGKAIGGMRRFHSLSKRSPIVNPTNERLRANENMAKLFLKGQLKPPLDSKILADVSQYQEFHRKRACEASRVNDGSKKKRSQKSEALTFHRADRVRSPPPVKGRAHCRIQTEQYLEEIDDRCVETDANVQTDPFLDRPASPLFVPSKTGLDKSTQLNASDLFDFNLEVAPILEVLVGKTIEQSMVEVMEEEELASLEEQQRIFHERRQAELAEQQRLAEKEKRLIEEKERRLEQRKLALEQDKETEAKVAAACLAQSYLADMLPATFHNLREKGFFYDHVERVIEKEFVPWLSGAVHDQLEKLNHSRRLIDSMLLNAIKTHRCAMLALPPLAQRPPPVFSSFVTTRPVSNSSVGSDAPTDLLEETEEDAEDRFIPIAGDDDSDN